MVAALHNKHLIFTCFNDTDFGKYIALLEMVKSTGNSPIWYPAYAPAIYRLPSKFDSASHQTVSGGVCQSPG